MFTFAVETACCFVQNDNRRIFQKCSGDCDTLTLSARKLDAAFTDQGFITFRQGFDKIIGICMARSLHYLLVSCTGVAITDIFPNGSMKETCVLGHKSDASSQTFKCDIGNALIINFYRASLNVKMAQEQ